MRHVFTFLISALYISVTFAQEINVQINNGHGYVANQMEVSPNGKYLLTTSGEECILWDLASSKVIGVRTDKKKFKNVLFSADGQNIITNAQKDNIIKVWKIDEMDKFRVLNESNTSNIVNMLINQKNQKNQLTSLSENGEISIWDLTKMSKVKTYTLPVTPSDLFENKYAIIEGDRDVKIWDIENNRSVRSFNVGDGYSHFSVSQNGEKMILTSSNKRVHIINLKTLSIDFSQFYKEYIQSIYISPIGDFAAYTISGSRNVFMIDLNQMSHSAIEIPGLDDQRKTLAIDQFGRLIVSKTNGDIIFFDPKSKDFFANTIKGQVLGLTDFHLINNQQEGIAATDEGVIKRYNLDLGTTDSYIENLGQVNDLKKIFLNDTSMAIYTSSKTTSKVEFWNTENRSKQYEYSFSKYNKEWTLKAIDWKNNSMLIGIDPGTNPDNDGFFVKSITDGSLKSTFRVSGYAKGLHEIYLSPANNYIATTHSWAGKYAQLIIWDNVNSMNKLWSKDMVVAKGSACFSFNGELFAASTSTNIGSEWDFFISVFESNSGIEKFKLGKGSITFFTSISFSKDGHYISAGNGLGELYLWDLIDGTLVWKDLEHNGKISSVNFLDAKSRILSTGLDGEVIIRDLKTSRKISTSYGLTEGTYATILPNNYYRASKDAFNYIHFTQGLDVFTFENFDLVLNRPDIVAKALGSKDEMLIEAYYKAYQKRLKKMGFNENQIITDLHLPEVSILSNDFPLLTDQNSIDVSISAKDTKYTLDRINVYVNGVPIFGSKGKSIKTSAVKNYKETIAIQLSSGQNKIQFSVHNSTGVESIRKTMSIRNTNEVKGETYIVSIGVSEYNDATFNLNYAAKDAKDVGGIFAADSTHLFLITNQNATKEKIVSVKNSLMKTTINDMVVVFVAGHGLLDQNLDYFIATHDVDFDQPSNRGLLYEDLESLLDGIPARKKLMLIDACNSGEVDEDASNSNNSIQIENSFVTSRGILKKNNNSNDKKSSLGLYNSFELMQELFADLRKGTGAVIISAASGREFAFESPEWNNGVFTYALREALRGNTADIDNNGTIEVSELSNYVAKKVISLTNGLQHPTSRSNNIENDFVVY